VSGPGAIGALCPPGFAETARTLAPIDCAKAPSVVSVRSPFSLADPTMPVVEALMVVGAVVALVHAVRWWRRTGDPTNVGLWAASVVYVLLLEPPLYFPDRFGLADQVGLIFVHDVFSVQFLFDRLPLYILAIYPALTYPAFVLVQRTGMLSKVPAGVGAACVGTVFHVFYEVFDQLGPQVRWWAWNPDAPSNTPWLASVPLSSLAVFAAASPFTMALLTQLLLARRAARGRVGGGELAARAVAVGALTPLGMVVFALPYGVVSRWPGAAEAAPAVALWAVPLGLAAVAVAGVRRVWADHARQPSADGYAVVAGVVFLVVFAGLWAWSLPAYLGAVDGRTAAGTPIGSLPYALACWVVAAAALAVSRRLSPGTSPADVVARRDAAAEPV